MATKAIATKAKARSAKQADLLSLIETMRWEPGKGFLRLDQHLRRLNRSADALGFRSAPADLVKQLEAAVSGEAPLHVRLAMTFRGNVEITTEPFAAIADDTVWRIRIAETRLPSDDPMYRHKTTRREIYDTARAEFAEDDAQEVIMLNERGEICEGTTTNIFVEQPDGTLITPAISCGLIAGILRGDLIREGRAKSGLVKPQELTGARLFVGNSLRGLIRAELVEA
ncbi:aminotransferase class IV family protein [Neorhizobium alkalisoli]|uniref:Probable branched-chain-amino-acid aminotransferase n=1 Tax=Neorhizobium alkalisoli TaxID=528178 RepID=A0A561QXJ4_9HYPH|nr:aminotransferase class IV family protein [Neorhizobium alkalisoli]TWF55077.1 4-amino-4-deoxychorismate lyase [Neorhizobium alkalisoli]